MSNDLITPGRHKATCIEFEFPEVEPGKSQAIALGFRLADGDVDQGRIITAWKYFTDGALAYTLEGLRACGWRGDDPSEITMADLGNEVELVIQHEEYPAGSGAWKAKVAFINPPGGGGMVKAERRLEGAGLKKFGAAMKAKIRSLGGAQRPRQAAQGNGQHTTRQADPHPNAPGGGGADWDAPPPRGNKPDDDIPF